MSLALLPGSTVTFMVSASHGTVFQCVPHHLHLCHLSQDTSYWPQNTWNGMCPLCRHVPTEKREGVMHKSVLEVADVLLTLG